MAKFMTLQIDQVSANEAEITIETSDAKAFTFSATVADTRAMIEALQDAFVEMDEDQGVPATGASSTNIDQPIGGPGNQSAGRSPSSS